MLSVLPVLRPHHDFSEFLPSRATKLDGTGYPPNFHPERMAYLRDMNYPLVLLQTLLQRVWRVSTLRDKHKAAFRLSEACWEWLCMEYRLHPSDSMPLYPFEQAVEFLIDNLWVANFCDCPMCPAPFYFAKRHSQKRCGEECANYFRKARQLQYWNDKGKKRREKRITGANTL